MKSFEFAKLIRDNYWATFATLPLLAHRLGMDLKELKAKFEDENWELQHPPALNLQNQPVNIESCLSASGKSSINQDELISDENGTASKLSTKIGLKKLANSLEITIHCDEPFMEGVSFTPPEALDPDQEKVWKAQCQRLREISNRSEFEYQTPPESVFSSDCVMLTITPVAIGDDQSYLGSIRNIDDPISMLKNPPPARDSKIYLEGCFYYIAIGANGRIESAFYDPWNGGVFWPCWKSGAETEIIKEANGWKVKILLPLANLEPLPVNNSVWGIDLFRFKPEEDLSRTKETILFRQEGDELGEKQFLTSNEEIAAMGKRHSYIASTKPFTEHIIPRDVPKFTYPEIDLEYQDINGEEFPFPTKIGITQDNKGINFHFDCEEKDMANLRVITREMEENTYGKGMNRCNYLDRREAFGIDWGDYVEINFAPGLDDTDLFHAGNYVILINSQGYILTRYYDPFGHFTLLPGEKWNPELKVKINKHKESWEVECFLPFSALYQTKEINNSWRMNFKRARGARDVEAQDPGKQSGRSLVDPTPEPASCIGAWSPEYGRYRQTNRWGKVNIDGQACRKISNGSKYFSGTNNEEPAILPNETSLTMSLNSVAFSDDLHGWAVGNWGTIQATSDGGKSWSLQSSGTDSILEKVCAMDKDTVFAVGGQFIDQHKSLTGSMGLILKSTNGGIDWETVLTDAGTHLYDICMVNEKTGYAAGECGLVLKTVDGGENWTHLPDTNTTNTLFGISFVDELNGFAAGECGSFISTSDGGKSWKHIFAPTSCEPYGFPAILRSVFFLDKLNGYLAGDRGTFLQTKDGGITWNPVYLGLNDKQDDIINFHTIIFANGEGLLTGDPGSVMFKLSHKTVPWEKISGPAKAVLFSTCILPSGNYCAVGEAGLIAMFDDKWKIKSPSSKRPRLVFGTAHNHHVASTPWTIAVEDFDIFLINSRSTGKNENAQMCREACLQYGMKDVRVFNDMIEGRRREPHRINHLYQNWHGTETMTRRMTAALRSLQPEAVICEWPVSQECYWAADVGLFARCLIKAVRAAGDPDAFPELLELGLEPWTVKKLYRISHNFDDLLFPHLAMDWMIEGKGDVYSNVLGMPVIEAMFRGRRTWIGLLDRKKEHKRFKPEDFHNIRKHTLIS